jgi:hypothetical protein
MSLASRISRMASAAACVVAVPLVALDGQPGLHDPSTVIAENGKYYVYATGGGLPCRSPTTAGRGGGQAP